MAHEVYIVRAIRTPIGSFGGSLAPVPATELGAAAIKATLADTGMDPARVEEVFFGNVCSANLGQAPARQAAVRAGLPYEVCCTTVNKVCASGMKAVMLGAQGIQLGYRDVVLAGGMESMSNVPYYLPGNRWGAKYGNGETVDGLLRDGLQDAYSHLAMGMSGDETAARYGITREKQDEYAVRSYKLAAEAWDQGRFRDEVAIVKVDAGKGKTSMVDKDEEYARVNFEKIPLLKPAFNKEGTVTAANASTLNDGAASILLVSGEMLKEFGLKPLARIVSFADAEQEPKWFTTTPTVAAPLALRKAGLELKDMDYFEVNEAFAVVALAFIQLLHLDPDRVNIHGGAVALGHPLGASGARILVTLAHILRQKKARYGLAAICNGGGGASAVILENMQ
ncbi:MAG TPA: acetyl-CoA C-acyltransferase [Saprospiraceae bacterium]|nr:acetyl-CoA C-acyltransferase [Saprospiraceae bacterium]